LSGYAEYCVYHGAKLYCGTLVNKDHYGVALDMFMFTPLLHVVIDTSGFYGQDHPA